MSNDCFLFYIIGKLTDPFPIQVYYYEFIQCIWLKVLNFCPSVKCILKILKKIAFS